MAYCCSARNYEEAIADPEACIEVEFPLRGCQNERARQLRWPKGVNMYLLSLAGAIGGAVAGMLIGDPFIGVCGAAGGFIGGIFALRRLRRSNPNWPKPKSNSTPSVLS